MPYQNQDPDVAAQEAQQGNTASDPDQNQALNAPTQAPQATLQDDGAIANQAGSAPQDDGSIANQAQPAQPIQQHHRFADMLAHLTGNQQTPVLDAQGRAIYDSQTGQVHTRKATVRDLGASILAGALSSLATSFANQPYRNGNGEWINPVNKNMQEQGEVGQRNSLQGRVQQAQQVSDQTRMRQYSTYEQNLKLLQLQHAVTREGDEAIQRNATYFKPLHDFVLNDPLLKGSIAEGGEDAGEKEVAAFMRKGHSPGEYTAIPTGARPAFDADGKPTGGLEQTFTVIHNGGKAELTKDLAQEYGYPQTAVGQTITLNQLMVHGIGNATEGSIGNALTSLNAKNKALNPESKDVTMADIRQNVPSSRNATILGQINTAMDSSKDPDQVLSEIRKVSPESANFLQTRWQTDETTYKAHRDKIEADAKRDATKLTQEQLLDAATNRPNTPEGKAATATLAAQSAQKGRDAAAEAAARAPFELRKQKQQNDLRTGTPEEAGALLASHDLTLTELKSRGSTPKFITDSVNAAKKFDPTYNAQKADAEYKIAGNQQNTTFFGSANSLTDKDGTLDQLAAQYAKLGNGKIPLFNAWKDYKNYQTGDPAMAGFYQTALGVADDYAKVMGGGTGSDTSRTQVMQSFANAHNPQAMAAAIEAARNAVKSQTRSRIGSNVMLQKMYGGTDQQQTQAQPQPVVPQLNQQPPAGAVGKMKGSDGQTYYVDANKKPISIVR